MTKINTTAAADAKPDFTVETNKAKSVTYYTPETPAAYDWCHGTPEGSANPRKGGMDGVPMFGRSFMFASDSQRANKLRGFLKGEGFVVALKNI